MRRIPASAAKRMRQRELQKRNNPKKHYWTPDRLYEKFPTEVDLLIGEINGDYSKIYGSESEKSADTWRRNYLVSLQNLIATSTDDSYVSAELTDSLDQMYWELLNMPLHKFLEGMDKYPEELAIRNNYYKIDTQLNISRIIERWSDII